jgi:two-component system, OmpR family, sensor kinase
MTLTTRLSTFFLAALAVTLLGFSLTVYGLAHVYLHRRFEERLQSALARLATAAEVEEDGIDWEPREPPHWSDAEGVVWAVHDDAGRLRDCSPNLPDDDPLRRPSEDPPGTDAAGRPRRVLSRTVPEDGPVFPPENQGRKPARLTLTVAAPTEPVTATLRALAAALAGVSAAVWLLAFVTGRWLCRRALRPLSDMTAAARAMTPEDRDRRLPVSASGDELATLGRTFNELLDRLQEAYERQRRFTGDASHQLRTPLTVLLGQVEVSLRQPRSPEEYRATLERVLAQGTNLKRIVEALLYLARADAEARLDDTEPLDLTAWLPRHLENWSGHPRRADLRLETTDGPPVWVRAQGPLLGQLLDNLLDNAFKYSAPGSPVTVRLEGDEKAATLTVEDHGCGIAAEELPRVFEAFYRGKTGRPRRPGVGLGLAVARRLARLFGGELEARSEPGQGSRFDVRLPRRRE